MLSKQQKDAIDNLKQLLNKAQKEAAKAAVNKATDAAGVTAASDPSNSLRWQHG